MDKLNVGVIGIGVVGMGHVERYRNYNRANLYAICDNDLEWLSDAKEMYRPSAAFTDYNEMLSDPKLDAVSICLPTALHAEATIAALNAGKHVLCEKPMALNAGEAREMKKIADETGKKLMISQNQRLEDNVRYLKRLADEDFFGDIYIIRTGWRRPMSLINIISDTYVRPTGKSYVRNFFNEKNNGGGVLRDLGSHMLDLSLFIAGFPSPVDTTASLYRKFYPDNYKPGKYICDAEDMAIAQINFDSGLSIQLEVSFCSHIQEDVGFTEIYGTKGGASRRSMSFLKLMSYKDGLTVINPIIEYDTPTIFPQHAIVDAVLDDTEVPVTAEQGVKVIEVLDAIYEAAGEIKL